MTGVAMENAHPPPPDAADRPPPAETPTQFVMRFPEDMPTEEVLRLAEASGITIAKDDVYLARYRMRQIRMDRTRDERKASRSVTLAQQELALDAVIAARLDADHTMPVPARPRTYAPFEFVSQYPLDTPGQTIKADAAKVGLFLSTKQITGCQGVMIRDQPQPKKRMPKPPPEYPSKSAFVRAQPVDMPPKEVIKAGKKAGFRTMDISTIYQVRATMRAQGLVPAKSSTAAVVVARSEVRKAALADHTSEVEQLGQMRARLKKLVLEMGMSQAKRVFAELAVLLEDES